MALKVWLPLNKDTKNNGLLSGITTTKKGTISFETGGPLCGYLVAGNGTQIVNGISVNTNLLDVLTGTSTVSVFVKPNGTHVHYNGTILSSGDWNSKCWAFGISQDNSSVDVFGPSYNRYINCTVPVGQWTHLVSIYDKQQNKGYLYKNSQYIGEFNFGSLPFSSTTNEFCVGRETYANGYFSFNGNICDLRIYDHKLTEEDIKRLYNCKTFDFVNQGNVAFDRDGQIAGGVIPYNVTTSDSAFYLNGSNAAIQIPFKKMQSGEFTMNTWFYKDSFGSKGWETIFGGQSGFELQTKRSSTNSPVIAMYSWNNQSAADISYSLNQWNMLTMTRTSSKTLFYLNGALKQSGSTGTIPNGNYFIGAWRDNNSQNFKGYIKEFSIYAKALEASDISKLYAIGPQVDVLPDGYTRLEYIQSTGTQVIQLNYKVNQTTEIESRWSNKTNGLFIYGCGVSNYLTAWAADGSYNWRFGGIALNPMVAYNSNGDNIIIQNKSYVLINGVKKGVYNGVTSFTSTSNLSLFGDASGQYNSTNGYSWVSAKCHYFKVIENGNLLYYLIPSKRKSDNVIGMFDMVSRQFFTNSGTGSFTGA